MENGEKRVRWRRPTEADLDECLAMESRHMGDNLVGKAAAREVWRGMLGHPAFCGAVIECYDPGPTTSRNGAGLPRPTRRIVGFGASVFVSSEFADAELSNPQPFADARLIAAVHHGQPVLLTSDAIARNNAGDGLNSQMIYGNCLASGKESGVTPEEDAEAQFILGSSYVELHAGYNLRVVFGEACGRQIDIMRRAGFANEAGTFPEVDRIFNVVTRAEAAAHPMSILASLFGSRRPVLQLVRRSRNY
ncbi:MAG: hypothetical protein M3O35_22530 [Acidobacteriota bacterium]|nr:hypothetical protein [Acidobacteriota bacterium]